jgi:SAM-dependent methyltransferase
MEHIYYLGQFGENWFTYPNLYRSWVTNASENSIFVEVGCWKGKSSAFLGVEIINSNKNIKLYCIDTWNGSIEHKENSLVATDEVYQLFLNNIKDLRSVITPIRTDSLSASAKFENESLDAVFIDASHQYEDVKNDINAWYPKVKHGGVLAGHDYHDTWPGVIQAVDEFFINQHVDKSENCWIYHKI